MQIIAMRTTTIQTFNIYAVLNGVMFGLISYDIVPYAWHFLPARFFPQELFNKLCFELPQKLTWTNE